MEIRNFAIKQWHTMMSTNKKAVEVEIKIYSRKVNSYEEIKILVSDILRILRSVVARI